MINFLGILFADTKMNLIIYFYETNRLYIIHIFICSFFSLSKKTCTHIQPDRYRYRKCFRKLWRDFEIRPFKWKFIWSSLNLEDWWSFSYGFVYHQIDMKRSVTANSTETTHLYKQETYSVTLGIDMKGTNLLSILTFSPQYIYSFYG